MTRVIQKSDGRGSLKNIQVLINKNQGLISREIKTAFKELVNEQIIWTSPLEQDDFAEYRDSDFISKVGLDPILIKLKTFWPSRGPQWDALGKTTKGHVILVEAKANIKEIRSKKSGAGIKSKVIIDKSLNESKAFLDVTNNIDWSGKYYQYTNRLAHLYFIREVQKKPAFLVNIYFIGDNSVAGPNTQQEWVEAINGLHSHLGLSSNKLSEFMTDVFIDTKELIQ